MRIKSSIVKWNFWCFETNVRKNVNEQWNVTTLTRFNVIFQIVNIVAIFVYFDVISNVAIKKCEFFDNIDAKQNIDFDVTKKNKRNERNERTNDC